MIGGTTSSLASFLPPATAGAIYGDPTVVTGGVFAPNGRGRVDGDTVTVTGRWQWGSGTQHCRWIVGGVLCDDDQFRVCFLDAADVTFHDTWYTSGLRGSGSLDFSVDGAVVPLERDVPRLRRPRSRATSPLGHFPNFTLLAAGVAADGARDRAPGARRAHRAGRRRSGRSSRQADAGPEPVHPDRAGPRRGRAAVGAGVPARRGGRGVGDVRRRRRGRRSSSGSPSASPAPTPPSRPPTPPTSPTRSPAARASTTRTCCSASCATPTSRPSTSRPRRSCSRPSAAPSSARRSTPPPSEDGSADARARRAAGALGEDGLDAGRAGRLAGPSRRAGAGRRRRRRRRRSTARARRWRQPGSRRSRPSGPAADSSHGEPT